METTPIMEPGHATPTTPGLSSFGTMTEAWASLRRIAVGPTSSCTGATCWMHHGLSRAAPSRMKTAGTQAKARS
eukprot:2061705-Prorocentrum_lima.AAC.1